MNKKAKSKRRGRNYAAVHFHCIWKMCTAFSSAEDTHCHHLGNHCNSLLLVHPLNSHGYCLDLVSVWALKSGFVGFCL
jgi:hypothetical protein